MNKLKCIFFDMGNTLLHFHHGKSDDEKDIQGLKYLTEYLSKMNKDITLKAVEEEFYQKWMDGIKDRKETHKEYPIEDFLNSFLQRYKLNLSIDQCIYAINLFYTEYREGIYYEENLYSILKEIKSKGYKIGVISNTCYYDEVILECFKKAKIYDLIDSYTFSYSLRIGKPNERIFVEALNKMKIKPEEAIMVGDNLNSDIKPALKLGMKTVLLDRKSNSSNDEFTAYSKISSISEVLRII